MNAREFRRVDGFRTCKVWLPSLASYAMTISAMTTAIALIANCSAEAADAASLQHCRVSLQVEESGKASLSLQRIDREEDMPVAGRTCQRRQGNHGECDYNYWFSDPKALEYLYCPFSNTKNVTLDPDTHMLHAQPESDTENITGFAGFGLPYRISLPFEIDVAIAAPKELSGLTHFDIALTPHHMTANSGEPTDVLINLDSTDGFDASAIATVSAIHRDPAGNLSGRPHFLARKPLTIGDPASRIEFDAVLPVGVQSKVYSVFLGATGTEPLHISNLHVFGITRPFFGYQMQQIGDAVVVLEVKDDCPAKKAGMRAGDQILSVDGREVRTLADANLANCECHSGMDSHVTVARRGTTMELILDVQEPHQPPEGPTDPEPDNQRSLAGSRQHADEPVRSSRRQETDRESDSTDDSTSSATVERPSHGLKSRPDTQFATGGGPTRGTGTPPKPDVSKQSAKDSSEKSSVTIGEVTIGSITFGSAEKDVPKPRFQNITVESLVPPAAKALLRLNFGKILRSEAGKSNMMTMLDSPTGQQQLLQLAQIQAAYGFNYLTDLESVTLVAPFPGGEPFNGILLVAEGNFQRQRIEKSLSIANGVSTKEHEGVTVYEKLVEGGGRIHLAFLTDTILVGAMEGATVIDAIRQAKNPPVNLPQRIADGGNAIPPDSSVSLILDASAFQRGEPEWQELRARVSWILISADMGTGKTITGVIEAKSDEDATVVRQRLEKVLAGGGGDQLIPGLNALFHPNYNSVHVQQVGSRVVSTIQASY